MDWAERMRRWVGWLCLGAVALLGTMGYHFGNIRFVPLVAGFAILAAVCFLDRGREEVRGDGVHPGANSGIRRASR